MKLTRKISVVAATFLLAAATGQYMQSTVHRGAPAPLQPKAPAPARAAEIVLPTQVTTLSATPDAPDASGAALRSAMPKMPVMSRSLPEALTAPAKEAAAPAATCEPQASATVDEGALINFHLDAPCDASARVVIRHGGLAFTALTDARGQLDVTVPAMQEKARVTAMFADDVEVSASTTVPELSLYDRVAVQWVGKDRFDLHALEFGAQFGEQGDISATNPGTPTPAAVATEGFMTVLGDSKVTLPMVAQVYSFPTRLSSQDGTVKLVIDADVTADTCGREMLAETLRTRKDQGPQSTDLSVAMPDCGSAGDGAGGFVQLSGMLPDIKVAGE